MPFIFNCTYSRFVLLNVENITTSITSYLAQCYILWVLWGLVTSAVDHFTIKWYQKLRWLHTTNDQNWNILSFRCWASRPDTTHKPAAISTPWTFDFKSALTGDMGYIPGWVEFSECYWQNMRKIIRTAITEWNSQAMCSCDNEHFTLGDIHPNFTGTVPNVDGLSQENYKVSQYTKLSRIPNPVPILSHFECNVTSHDDKVYTYRPNTYT